MQVKCEYCRQMIDAGVEKCPHCGATISANRVANKQPQTIEELQEWYKAHNLPPEEVTRFFIGKDYKEPKAFGIYKDINGEFVVYKNKADKTRAIRYRGVDEAYAVNELYQKLREEISNQKKRQSSATKFDANFFKNFGKAVIRAILVVLGIYGGTFALIALIFLFDKRPARGYYDYNGNTYYYQQSKWYEYDSDTDDWYRADNEEELDDAITSDTDGDYSTSWSSGKDFEDTNWYDAGSSDDGSDWDSDSSWDSSDSWDSGSSDWDSDW